MIEIVYIFLATWWFTHFEPLQEFLAKRIPVDHPVWGVLLDVLSCWKCLGFWVALVVTLSLFSALIVSFSAWFVTKLFIKR